MANLRRNWLKFLSDDDVNKIDEASRRVLSEVGVKLEDTELTEKLMDKGCTNNNGRVQFPSEIIDVALAGLPNEIVFSGRSGEKLDIKEGSVATHTGASIPYLYDLETGRKRDATLADLQNMIRLMNQLEHLSMCGAVVMPQDVPVSISEVIQLATQFRLGQKPGAGSAVSNAAQARYVAELYQTMANLDTTLIVRAGYPVPS